LRLLPIQYPFDNNPYHAWLVGYFLYIHSSHLLVHYSLVVCLHCNWKMASVGGVQDDDELVRLRALALSWLPRPWPWLPWPWSQRPGLGLEASGLGLGLVPPGLVNITGQQSPVG